MCIECLLRCTRTCGVRTLYILCERTSKQLSTSSRTQLALNTRTRKKDDGTSCRRDAKRPRPTFKHLQAARTAVGSSAAHAGSLATVASAAGGIALAAAATSVAAAVRLSLEVGGVPDRRPGRPIGSAVRRRRRARHHRASGRAAIDAAPRAPAYSTTVAGATATAAAAAAW